MFIRLRQRTVACEQRTRLPCTFSTSMHVQSNRELPTNCCWISYHPIENLPPHKPTPSSLANHVRDRPSENRNPRPYRSRYKYKNTARGGPGPLLTLDQDAAPQHRSRDTRTVCTIPPRQTRLQKTDNRREIKTAGGAPGQKKVRVPHPT